MGLLEAALHFIPAGLTGDFGPIELLLRLRPFVLSRSKFGSGHPLLRRRQFTCKVQDADQIGAQFVLVGKGQRQRPWPAYVRLDPTIQFPWTSLLDAHCMSLRFGESRCLTGVGREHRSALAIAVKLVTLALGNNVSHFARQRSYLVHCFRFLR